ncbi:MAG: TerC/Alx family metal homeostasis membrane protein [Chitinophagales bacterium]
MLERFGDTTVLYALFGILILVFMILDLGILVRRKVEMTLRSALIQTFSWITAALSFGILVYIYHGKEEGLQYISAYLMEYSLSADNLFVFIIILTYFKVSQEYYHKVLFYGIMGAVVFRLIFILVGIEIVEEFHWTLYIFGAILIYTGASILLKRKENEFNPEKNILYKILRRYLRMLDHEAGGNFSVIQDGKWYFSKLFPVIVIIASTDLVFALDSIPAVFAISQDRLVIITSNVFAVMGLRAMFFLLSHAANKFEYLQQGISLVLIFIGVKMIIGIFDIHIATLWSLLVIAGVLVGSILLSVLINNEEKVPLDSDK